MTSIDSSAFVLTVNPTISGYSPSNLLRCVGNASIGLDIILSSSNNQVFGSFSFGFVKVALQTVNGPFVDPNQMQTFLTSEISQLLPELNIALQNYPLKLPVFPGFSLSNPTFSNQNGFLLIKQQLVTNRIASLKKSSIPSFVVQCPNIQGAHQDNCNV